MQPLSRGANLYAPSLWFQGIPERETVRLGAWVGLSNAESREAGSLIDALYADIEAGDLFERRESPLLDSWVRDRGHFWLALPEARGRAVPLVVFVHGSGGSFQAFPQLLAREAVRRGFAIAFPSHGFGHWSGRDAAERIGRVVDAVGREVKVDAARVALVGLSAGGVGVFAAAVHEPERYRAVVGVSAVVPDLRHCEPLRGTRVLLLHGTEDQRVPIEAARRACALLEKHGVAVELQEEKASHLALLTSRGAWAQRIFDWLAH